jgi:hypothetical protein
MNEMTRTGDTAMNCQHPNCTSQATHKATIAAPCLLLREFTCEEHIAPDYYKLEPIAPGQPDRREETIRQLIEIRAYAAMDLATMPSVKQGTDWHLDRQKDVDYCNRTLARLGHKD